jgi:hypothetical protein
MDYAGVLMIGPISLSSGHPGEIRISRMAIGLMLPGWNRRAAEILPLPRNHPVAVKYND